MDSDDILRRVPPQNLEAEQSVLGAILLDNEAANDALEIVAPGDFYREAHREIFGCMGRLALASQPIDAITLTDALRGRGKLELVGGPGYIAELSSIVPTAANIAHYARIVRDRAVKRALASEASAIAAEAYDASSVDAATMVDAAERRIFALAERGVRNPVRSAPELTRQALKRLEEIYENKSTLTGLSTGFIDLDKLTAGLQDSDLFIVAARPGMGKTAFALNLAANAAMDPQRPVGVMFFSVEMPAEQLWMRLLCSEARVDWARARSGFLRESDFPRLAAASTSLSATSFYIDDSSDTSPLSMRAKCRRLSREVKLGLIVVDYIQLMGAGGRGAESREREIADITRALKALAKELKVPVVALSQLNRQVETRPERRPLLADLRESGAIEQDADVIAFIYRDEYYKGRESKEPGTAEIIIAKQRNGPTDTVKLAYIREFTRFEDYTPQEG